MKAATKCLRTRLRGRCLHDLSRCCLHLLHLLQLRGGRRRRGRGAPRPGGGHARHVDAYMYDGVRLPTCTSSVVSTSSTPPCPSASVSTSTLGTAVSGTPSKSDRSTTYNFYNFYLPWQVAPV